MAIIGIPAAGIIDSTADSQALIEGTGTRANLQDLISDYDLEVGNILNHGAIPDDTGQRAANDTAIANALSEHNVAYIPRDGVFYVSAPIEIADYQALIGQDRSTLSTDDLGAFITYDDYCIIYGLQLTGPGSGSHTSACFVPATDASRTFICNVRLNGFKQGFLVQQIANLYVENFIIASCETGIYFGPDMDLGGGSGLKYGNAIAFKNGEITGCQDGINLLGPGNVVSFNDITIQGNTRYGVYRPTGSAATVPVNIVWRNCHIEGNGTTQVYFETRADFPKFERCRIVGTGAQKGVVVGDDSTLNNLVLDHCQIKTDDPADQIVLGDAAFNTEIIRCFNNSNQGFVPTGSQAEGQRNTCIGRDNFTATVDPVSGNNITGFYSEGSRWRNTISGDLFLCTDRAGTWELVSGYVSKTGTPVDNQVAFWADATTVEGDASFTYDPAAYTAKVVGPTGTGSSSAGVIILDTLESSIEIGDQLGRIEWRGEADSGGPGANAAAAIWAEGDDPGVSPWNGSNNWTDIVFAVAPSGTAAAAQEEMRLKSNGTLIVGSVDGGGLRTYGTTGTSGAFFQMNTQRTVITDTNILGTIKFGSQADVVTDNAAAIRARASGTWTGTSVPTEMLFYTATDTGTGLVEALRIDENQICTFVNDPIIPDEVYGVGWDGSLEPPTKNAVYDKIETLGGGGDMLLGTIQTVSAAKTFNDGTLLLDDSDTSFDLILGSTSTITTANKKLTFDVNDSDRTLTISGDATVSGSNTGDSQTLAAGVSDVTATAAELNLLDLAGLTVGWGLVADSATTASWQALPGGGNVSNTGTPVDNQIAIWTNATTIEGVTSCTFDPTTYTMSLIGPTGTGSACASTLKLDTAEGSIVVDDILGRIDFHASTETGGPAGGGVAASIYAISEETWSSNNRTSIAFAIPPLGFAAAAQEEFRMKASTTGAGGVLQVGVTDGAAVRVLGTTGTSGAFFQMNTQHASIEDTNILGTIKFGSAADVVTDDAAAIRARASGTWSGTDVPTEMLFYTSLTTGTGLVEAMRIDENQNVSIAAGDLTLTTGDIGLTGSRVTKGWFTDLEVTNAIAGSITGNAATVTTNANLTGDVTSVGNATTIAVDAVDIAMLSATGVADNTTFLRGDNQWATPGGSGDMVLASEQTVTGAKTFDAGTLLLNDTDSAFDLELGSTSTITAANKTLTFDVNDANRTLTISGDATVTGSNTGDQTDMSAISDTMADFDTACSNGDFVYQGQALGTPSSGTATNLSGTAASLTAGNVTTNANLTGPITSVGNATTITADSVTMDNLVDIATDTFLGRVTAATGTVEVLTNAQAKTALDLTGTNSGDSQTLAAGVSDVTATAAEVNLLDLAGLTVGWGLIADSATTASWQALPGGGDVTAAATIGDNLLVRGDGAVKGVQNTGITVTDTDDLQGVAILGTTGARLTKGWFTDLEVTNAIAGSVTGNAATVTTNANLTGPITSVGNATTITADSVTMDHLVDIATDTFLGRVTAATGTVEVLTNAQAKTALDLTGTNSGDSQTLADGVSDVTATAAELNLLDLAGLTVGWGLVADSATTASWQALPGGVSVSGTPSDGQIAVWTNATTIEGDASFKFDTTDDSLSVLGYVVFTEQAAARAPTAGQQALWVKNTGTGELYFTDDAGTDHRIDNQTAPPSASTTVEGISELATAAEIDTGTDTGRVLSCNEFNDSIHGLKVPAFEVIDYSTAVATGDGQRYFRCDAQLDGMNLVTVGLCVGAAKSSSGAITITLTRMRAATAGAASRTEALMTSTGFDIDSAEWDSKDSSNGTIDTANDDILEGDVIRVDVDAAGTGAQGLFVTLGFRKP